MSWKGARLIVIAAAAISCAARADEIQPTPTLPPTGGEYVLPTICVSNTTQGACVENGATTGFSGITSIFGTGQAIDATLSLRGDVFAFDGTNIGPLLGSVTLTGTVDFTVSGRTSDSELGAFATQLGSLDLTGTGGGHAFELMLNPEQTSTGSTTISAFGPDFRVSSFFDVFVELSIDNGAFIPDVASRHVTLESVPEPGTAGLAFLGLTVLIGVSRYKASPARGPR
jgi:hypothetical protein